MQVFEEWCAWRSSVVKGHSNASNSTPRHAEYQLMLDIEQWDKLYSESRFRDLLVLYYLSPEWERLWSRLWTEFDELNDRCRFLRVPDGWKQGCSEYRAEGERQHQMFMLERERHLEVSSSSDSDVPNRACPLSAWLRRHQGTTYSTNAEREYSWRATLSDWELFRSLLKDGSQHISMLSSAERSSYQILEDWWCSAYSSPHLIAAVRDFISKHGEISLYDQECLPYNVEEDDEILDETLCRESLYHSRCFQLWVREFNPLRWEPFLLFWPVKGLEAARCDAIKQASLQRIGYACLFQEKAPLPNEYISAVRDQYIPWLRDQSPAGLPHYLWDVAECCTVTVSELPFVSDYTCISHTWGRWRLDSYASIPGVPWLVPENSLYNVRMLPDMFFQLGVRYVWFDLFCIPQDGSLIADIEIGRQTEIFRHANNCVAWLHDVCSWGSVRSALDWIGLRFLTSTTAIQYPGVDYSSALRHAEEGAAQDWPELIKTLTQPDGSDTLQPASWFSSLWTLQEAVLCPDMKLCSQDWDVLTDRRGNHLTLAVFCGLISEFNRVCVRDWTDGPSQDSLEGIYPLPWSRNPAPESTKQLIQVLTQTRLSDAIETRSPMAVLMTAPVRQCTSDRELAIMSAIGITDWYNRRLSQGLRPQEGMHKIFGLYDIDFVREAAQKFGAAFYWGDVEDITRLTDSDCTDGPSEKHIGSMLPFSGFSRSGDRAARSQGAMLDPARLRKEHPAVAGWEVLPNGAVRIHMAGITASSKEYQASSAELTAMIWWVGQDQRQPPGTIDFMRSLRDIACGDDDSKADDVVYAVALFTDPRWQYGVLLQSPRCGVDQFDMRRLVKIGKYVLRTAERGTHESPATMPDSTVVDWLVV